MNASKITLISIFAYALALLLVASSATFAWRFSSQLLEYQKLYAAQINLAGRQRMLTQRIMRASERYLLDANQNPENADIILNCSNLLLRSHYGIISFIENEMQSLIDEGIECRYYLEVLPLGYYNNTEVVGQFTLRDVERYLLNFVEAAQRIPSIGAPSAVANQVGALREIGDVRLIELLDQRTLELQYYSQRKIEALESGERTAWITTLLLLVFEALFIFLPIVKINRRAINRMQSNEIELRRYLKFRNTLSQSLHNTKEFYSHMSHELRTPLNAIIGFADTYIHFRDNEKIDVAKCDEYFHYIRDASYQLKYLVDDLLDFSKIEMGEIEVKSSPTCVRKIFEQAINHLESEIAAFDIKIDVTQLDQRIIINTDDRIFYQIVVNILSNAIKYSYPGGRLLLRALKLKDGRVKILVRDYGVGMTEDEISLARKPFMRVENPMVKRQGTGLGIPIVEMLLAKIGGAFKIKSVPNKGTAVTFTLQHQAESGATTPTD